jgi:ribosomal 50S subunit-associated protein YjgA (DUF615 family)
VNKGEIHIQLTRRVPETQLTANSEDPKLAGVSSGNAKLQRTAGKVMSSSLSLLLISRLEQFPFRPFLSLFSPLIWVHVERSQVRSLIRKAMALAEEEEETEDIRQMLEELEGAEEERESTISQLQKDRNLLIAKVRELEQAMSGFI